MFKKRENIYDIEEGNLLSPKFDNDGLIPVITMCSKTKEILMHGYMNKEALKLSIETKNAHYWSRSRQSIWKKGEKSGLQQKIKKIRIDDDQDCIIIFVELEGLKASCHVGYKSCFYRELKSINSKFSDKLVFIEKEKVFDPEEVYGDIPNPTKL